MSADRIRRNGVYAPLYSRYYEDDAIDLAGPDAELLFVRGLAFSAGSRSDGFISTRQVVRVTGMGLPNAEESAKRLAEVGLWLPDDTRGGYTVRSWLRWNRSHEEIEESLRRDAARKRAGRGASGRTPDGVRAESAGSPRHNTVHNTTLQSPSGPSGSGKDSHASAPAGAGARAPAWGDDEPADDPALRAVPPPPEVAELRKRLAAKRARGGAQ